MTPAHLLNISVHIGAGTIAIAIGCWILATAKGTTSHRKKGRLFAWFSLAVCASAVIGNSVFRFMPLFAVLTVLVLYQLLSGWHAVYTKASGPNSVDAMLCVGAALWGIGLVPLVLANPATESTPVVIYSTLAALFLLIAYDALRWVFPRRWHTSLWRYEHIYKLLSSLAAMASAAAGNLLPQAQPWSQLLPSAAGILSIAWFCFREAQRRGKVKENRLLSGEAGVSQM